MKKTLVILTTFILVFILCLSANAAEEKVVIDNVVYELTEHKTYGQHYAVRDFMADEALAESTTKIKIVGEIDGIEVMGINTNYSDCEDFASYEYREEYPSVKKITIPTTVKYIGAYAFTFFPSIEKIQLPAELELIGEGAFYSMDSLKSITLPEGIISIPFYTFKNCKNLEKVVFQGEVKYIGEHAFMKCEKLSSVNFPDSLEDINNAAFYGTAFKKLVLPAGVSLWEDPFANCEQLKKIVFESDEPVDYIGIDIFNACNNVEAIYIKAIATKRIFIDCVSAGSYDLARLKNIYFEGSEALWNELVFEHDRAAIGIKDINVEFYYKHSHSFTRSGNPTCKKGGTYTCTCECGDNYKVTLPKDPNAHKYGSWKVIKEANCAENGIKRRTCKYCGKVQEVKTRKEYLGKAYRFRAETVKANEITLTWKEAENATGYRVYQYDEATEKFVKLASIKNKTTYTVKNLESGKSYRFAVEPYNKAKNGSVAFAGKTELTVTTIGTAPKNLQATSTKEGVVELTWDSCGEDVHYGLHYGTNKEHVEAGWERYDYVTENKATIKKLKSGETYYFLVKTDGELINGVRSGQKSETISIVVK